MTTPDHKIKFTYILSHYVSCNFQSEIMIVLIYFCYSSFVLLFERRLIWSELFWHSLFNLYGLTFNKCMKLIVLMTIHFSSLWYLSFFIFKNFTYTCILYASKLLRIVQCKRCFEKKCYLAVWRILIYLSILNYVLVSWNGSTTISKKIGVPRILMKLNFYSLFYFQSLLLKGMDCYFAYDFTTLSFMCIFILNLCLISPFPVQRYTILTMYYNDIHKLISFVKICM